MKIFVELTQQQQTEVVKLGSSRQKQRIQRRAYIIWKANAIASEGKFFTIKGLAEQAHCHRHTSGFWLREFRAGGAARLAKDARRSGRPSSIVSNQSKKIRAALRARQARKVRSPSFRQLAARYGVSHMALWRLAKSLKAQK